MQQIFHLYLIKDTKLVCDRYFFTFGNDMPFLAVKPHISI